VYIFPPYFFISGYFLLKINKNLTKCEWGLYSKKIAAVHVELDDASSNFSLSAPEAAEQNGASESSVEEQPTNSPPTDDDVPERGSRWVSRHCASLNPRKTATEPSAQQISSPSSFCP